MKQSLLSVLSYDSGFRRPELDPLNGAKWEKLNLKVGADGNMSDFGRIKFKLGESYMVSHAPNLELEVGWNILTAWATLFLRNWRGEFWTYL